MVISYVIILKDLSLSFNQSECEIMKSTKSVDRYALLSPCIMHMPRIWKIFTLTTWDLTGEFCFLLVISTEKIFY